MKLNAVKSHLIIIYLPFFTAFMLSFVLCDEIVTFSKLSSDTSNHCLQGFFLNFGFRSQAASKKISKTLLLNNKLLTYIMHLGKHSTTSSYVVNLELERPGLVRLQ